MRRLGKTDEALRQNYIFYIQLKTTSTFSTYPIYPHNQNIYIYNIYVYSIKCKFRLKSSNALPEFGPAVLQCIQAYIF